MNPPLLARCERSGSNNIFRFRSTSDDIRHERTDDETSQ